MSFRALFLSILVAPLASAQPITTDRPDFTESTAAVGAGQVQVEAGAILAVGTADNGSSTATLSGPEALFRIGLVRGTEARLVLPDLASEVRRPPGGAVFSGGSLGAKIELPAAGSFATATILDLTLSDGDRPQPRAVLIADRDLTRRSAVGGQVEVLYDPDAGRVLTGGTLVIGVDVGRRVGAFAELAAFGVPVGPASVVFHTGSTMLLTEALQIDVHGGIGLTESAPDAFVAAGGSVRF